MTKSTTQIYTYSHTVWAWNWDCTVSLSVWTDLAWNLVTATPTSWATFTIDNTAPAMLSATRQSNTVLFVTLSENCDDATLTQANDWWFVVYEIWTPATAYVVSATAKNGSNSNIIELTVADMTASAAVWVTITYSSTWNWIIADPEGNEMATDATWVNASAWS